MSNAPYSKRSYAPALVLFALLLGAAGGAAAVLWLWKSGATAGPMSSAEAAGPASTGPCNGKPAKLYRNPMGSPDTSPVPKKDSMGMDYIPVCEDTGESQDDAIVKVSLDRVQRLGVRSEAVEKRALARTVRAFASVQYDERRQAVVAVTPPYVTMQHERQQQSLATELARVFEGVARFRHVNLGRTIDLHDPSLSRDGVHTTSTANRIIAQALARPIVALLESR